MSAVDGSKNISRLRTFQDDVAYARNKKNTKSEVVVDAQAPLTEEKPVTPVIEDDPKKDAVPEVPQAHAPLVSPDPDIEKAPKALLHTQKTAQSSMAAKLQIVERMKAQNASTPQELPKKETPAQKPKKPAFVKSVNSGAIVVTKPLPKRKPLLPEAEKEEVHPKEEASGKYMAFSEDIAQVKTQDKESLLSDNDDVYTEGTGTIIRDTQRKRFHLLPAIFTGVQEWFNEIKEEYEAAMHPIHTVSKAEVRAEVIQKAVSLGEQAPKEDFKEVAKRLKSAERRPLASTLAFKKKNEVAAPAWSHMTDEDSPKVPEALPLKEEELKKAEGAPVVPYVPEKKEEPKTAVPTTEVPLLTQAVVAPLPQPKEEPVPKEKAPIEERPVVLRAEEPVKPKVQMIPAPRYEEMAVRTKQDSFPLVALAMVVIIATLSGIGISYYWFVLKDKDATSAQEAIVFKIPELVNTQTKLPVAMQSSRLDLLTAILQVSQASKDTTEIYTTMEDSTAVQKPAPTETILQVLELRAPGSFTRSIKEMVFGGTDAAQPFIVLKIGNFDSAFAGMLDWEQNMSADLFPLFGQPVTETFDPSARTDTQVRSAFFKDAITSNKNVRILLDAQGNERIIYTFVNQNTILITTTSATLEGLLPLVQ